MALKLGTLSFDIGANTDPLKKGVAGVEKQVNKTSQSFSKLGSIIKVAIAGETARRLLLMADGVRILDTRLRNLSKTQKDYEKSSKALITTANDTGQAFRDVVVFFERSTRALEDLGATNTQVLQFTDTIQKLGVLGGNSVDEIANGTRQLNQALQGGIVRAEEFNSIVENTPMIANAIAEELGKSTGELRKMVMEGQLTSDKVFNAILKQSKDVNEEFKDFPRSIKQAANALTNEFGLALAAIDKQAGGITDSFSRAINETAKDLKWWRELIERPVDPEFERIGEHIELLQDQTKNLMDTLENREGSMIPNWFQEAFGDKRTNDEISQQISENVEMIQKLIGEQKKLSNAETEVLVRTGGTGPTSRNSRRKTDNEGVQAFQIDALGDQFEAIELKYKEHEERLAEIVITSTAERTRLETELEKKKNEEIAAMQVANVQQTAAAYQSGLSLMGDFASNFAAVLEASGNKNKAIVKAAFLFQKAADVASIIASTEVGAAKADAVAPGSGSFLRGIGYANAAMVGGLAIGQVSGGRQQGGPTTANSLYDVTENGAPEMFVSGNKQYLMTGSRGGKVVSGGAMSQGSNGGGAPNVTIVNNTGVQATAKSYVEHGELRVILSAERAKTGREVEQNIAAGIEQNNGVVNNALNSNTQMTRRLT